MVRHPLGVPTPKPGFSVAKSLNLDSFFWAPIQAGFCAPADLKIPLPSGDPKYDLADFCDFNEVLILQAVNEDKARKSAEQKSKSKKGKR